MLCRVGMNMLKLINMRTNVWKDSGCPQTGDLAKIKGHTRMKYHSTIKYIKKNNNYLIKYKTANSLLNKSFFSSFWSEIRTVRNLKINLPDRVDNISGDSNISNYFKECYQNLYNSVDDPFLENIKYQINSKISNCSDNICKHTYKFNIKK